MNDDYLWDRTGEPDPDIQQLEDVLGALRYQPQALELPPGIRPERQRNYFRPLAVAAAIAFLVLAAGLWIQIHRPAVSGHSEVASQPPTVPADHMVPVASGSPSPSASAEVVSSPPERGTVKRVGPPRKNRLPDSALARARHKQPNSTAAPDNLSIAELDQARAAKEQLMLALRLASAKLNFAQRKTQGPPAPSTIRNQHKVG